MPTASRTKAKRWAIRVTFGSGDDAWLRHGATVGEGAIVLFRTRAKAEAELAFVMEGLSDEDTAAVVQM